MGQWVGALALFKHEGLSSDLSQEGAWSHTHCNSSAEESRDENLTSLAGYRLAPGSVIPCLTE